MATRDFSLSELTYYWYYYKLTDGNRIPIFVFEIPLSATELKTYDDVTISNLVVTDQPLYIWSYENNSLVWYYKNDTIFSSDVLLDDHLHLKYYKDGDDVYFSSPEDKYSFPYFTHKDAGDQKLNCCQEVYFSFKYPSDGVAKLLRVLVLHTTDDKYFELEIPANAPGSGINVNDITYTKELPTATKKGYVSITGHFFYDTSYEMCWYKSRDPDITKVTKKILGLSTEADPKDPNKNAGDSKPNGGGGDGDIGGDTNPDDGLPTISALDSGLLTAYNPTVAELQSLGRFLWSDSFDISTFKKLFNDPFDTLLGLSVVPVKPNTSGTKSIMFGNMDSGVSAPVVSNQWVTKDMGSVTLNEVWKGALDYAPSTGVTIYLPFIGMRQLNVNDVMGSTLHLIYKFDVLTGSCIAQIYVNHSSQGNKDAGFSWTKNQGLLYEFIGQCAENIPLASQDYTNTIRAAISGATVAAGAAASIATGNPALGVASLTVGAANLGMQASTPTVERGGHLSGSASILGYSQPFLIVERPHQCKPSRYYALRGVPSQVYTSKLSKCTNFTQITANNNLHIAGASDSELTELQNLLVAGVYFPNKKR